MLFDFDGTLTTVETLMLEARDGRLTGRYAGAQCASDEKVRRVRALAPDWPREFTHAHGDTPEDHPMLAMAALATYRGAPWPNGDAVR